MSGELLLICPECKAVQPVKHDFCVRCGASLESAQVVRSLSPIAAGRPQTPQTTEQKSTKSRVPIVVALLSGIMAGARYSSYGGSSEVALIHGVVIFLFWWAVLAVVFRLVHPKNRGDRVGLAIATVVGVPAITMAAIGILLLAGPFIGAIFSPAPTAYTAQPLAVVRTSTPAPSPRNYSNPTPVPAGQGPWWQRESAATADLTSVPSRPRPTNTARPVVKQPSLTLPAQPSPKLPTPTGRDESFNQTVTAIGNRLATAEADATTAARYQATTPTPAVCRENVSVGTPRHGSTVKGLVDIRGTATLSGFQYYKLEFSSRAQPAGDEWITIGELHDQPVVNGELGVWDTSRLPKGQHWLRLVVVDQSGNYPEPCRVLVVVSK